MESKRAIKVSWANEELAHVIKELHVLHGDYKENSHLIQHELIESAIEKLCHAYSLSIPNKNLDALLIVDALNNAPLQVDHFN